MNPEPEPPLILEKRNNILQGAEEQRKQLVNPPSAPSKLEHEISDVVIKTSSKRQRSPKQIEQLRKAREKKRAKRLQKSLESKAIDVETSIKPKAPIVDFNQRKERLKALLSEQRKLHLENINPLFESGTLFSDLDGTTKEKEKTDFGRLPDVLTHPEQTSSAKGEEWQDGASPFRFKGTSISRLIREIPNTTHDMFTLGKSDESAIGKIESKLHDAGTLAALKQRSLPVTASPGHDLSSYHSNRPGFRPSIIRRNGISEARVKPSPSGEAFK